MHQAALRRSMVKIVNGEIIPDHASSGPQSTPLPNPWSTARPAGRFTACSASSLDYASYICVLAHGSLV